MDKYGYILRKPKPKNQEQKSTDNRQKQNNAGADIKITTDETNSEENKAGESVVTILVNDLLLKPFYNHLSKNLPFWFSTSYPVIGYSRHRL